MLVQGSQVREQEIEKNGQRELNKTDYGGFAVTGNSYAQGMTTRE